VAAEAALVTASRLGLALLTAIALGLGVIVALDQPPGAVARSNRLLPGLEIDQIVRVELRRDEGTIVLVRGERGWSVETPVAGPADPSAVADLLGALELASAERWISEDPGPLRVEVAAHGSQGDRWRLSLHGDGPAGTVRARGEAGAALVEAWVARALDRRADDLRRRAVITASPPTGIELHAGGVDLVASGVPLRAHLPTGTVRLAPGRADALVAALAALRFVRFPEVPGTTAGHAESGTSGIPEVPGTLRVLGGAEPVEIEERGACPGAAGERWLGGTAGEGCVEGDAWEAVIEAGRAIVEGPLEAVDPSPIPAGKVSRIELVDGAVVEARGGGWTLTIGGVEQEADSDAVAGLIAALRAPGRVVASRAVDGATVTVLRADGTSVVMAVFGSSLQRAGEPYAIEIGAELRAMLAGGWRVVADRVLLAEEPTLLRRVAVAGTAVTMGATFEEWSSPAGQVDLAAIDALRELIAGLEADELLPPGEPFEPATTIELGFDAPPAVGAQAFTRTVAVARPDRDGRCRARVEGVAARLPADACAALLAPLVR
jgi:hypothetical protein